MRPFEGWRRKCGSIILVISLVFICGWVRSIYIGDIVAIILDTEMDTLMFSANGTFGVGQIDNFNTWALFPETTWETENVSDAIRIRNRRFHLNPGSKVDLKYEFPGVVVVVAPASWVVVASYSMIALPLSLLSAYLLLFAPKIVAE